MARLILSCLCGVLMIGPAQQEKPSEKRIKELEREIEKLKKQNNPYFPFVDNSDGTITDTRANLVWTKKSFGPVDSKNFRSKAPLFVKTFPEQDGPALSNHVWQVATIAELQGLYVSLGQLGGFTTAREKDRRLGPFDWSTDSLYRSRTWTKEGGGTGCCFRLFNFATGSATSDDCQHVRNECATGHDAGRQLYCGPHRIRYCHKLKKTP